MTLPPRGFIRALVRSFAHPDRPSIRFAAARCRHVLTSSVFVAVSVLALPAAEPLTEQQQKFLKEAEAGDAWAQYEVGLFTEDETEASKWFLRSAQNGNPFAMAIIGARYIRGQGVAQDHMEGARWQLKAFEQDRSLVMDYGVEVGDVDSAINDRYITKHGTDEQRALLARAKKGEPAAMTELAKRLLQWEGLLGDKARAKQLLLDAVAKDYTPAFALLGDFLSEFEQDTEGAAKLNLRAAERGVPEAQYALAYVLETGDGGVTVDEAAARAWYLKAAEAGHGEAMMKQAELALAANDEAAAVAWATKANQANVERAERFLSEIETAKAEAAIEAQMPEGLPEERRARMREAISGDADAQYAIGLSYQSGTDFPRDTDQMLKWFTLSAENGKWEAQMALGSLYHYGLYGVTADRANAEKWLSQAATSGEEEAVYRLARLYAEEPERRPLAREMLGKLTLDRARELLARMDEKDNPQAAAQPTATDAEMAKRNAMQAIATASAELERSIQASTSPEQRKKAVTAFSEIVSSQYDKAGMTRPAAEDLVLKTLLPFLEQRRNEAFEQVNAIHSTVFSKDALPRVLPSSLCDTIKSQAERVVAEYAAEQKRWDEIRALHRKAEAGDIPTMATLAAEYLNAPGGIEKNWESAMVWVNKVRARSSDAANTTHNKVSAYVNTRSDALLQGDDRSAAIEFLEKVGSHFEFDAANCRRLGLLHLSANGGHSPNIPKAIHWLERAAGLGSLESMQALGILHVTSSEHPVDERVALNWFQQAAAKGDVIAQQWVELLQSSEDAAARAAQAKKIVDDQRYAAAREKPPGPNKINEWDLLRYASNLGNGDAMAALGIGSFVATDDPEAIAAGLAWLKRSEAAGSVAGLRGLGLVYLRGMGVAKDVPLALDYLTRAAELGDAQSAELMGQHWREQKDWDKAEKAWVRAAMMGSVTAMVRLAELAEDGRGGSPNLAEAIRLWEEIAGLDDSYRGYAMYRLGLMHREGRGVPKDESKLLAWIQKGAEAGWPEAKREWGKAEQASNQPTLASDQAAAAKGDANAMNRLGERYLAGDGVAKDEALARAWFEKSAALGNLDADETLAVLDYDKLGQVGAEMIAAQQSAMKREIDAAAAAAPQPGVTIIKIPGADEAITSVRYLGGWYVAVGVATQTEGGWRSKIWFSRDARTWELRFTASEPLEDVAFAHTEHLYAGTFLLVLSQGSRSDARVRDVPTWISSDPDGRTWEEIHGDVVLNMVSSVDGMFVTNGWRFEGNTSHARVNISRDAREWINYERLPAPLAAVRPPARWEGHQMYDGRIYRASSHATATWAIRSSDDLQSWSDECLIPAPDAGTEHETEPHLCASEDMFLAGTMVAMGEGPVRFYRKKHFGDGWERITPKPSWNYLHGLSYAGGRFVAVASREDLRVSKDGLHWKVVATVRPYSPRFAVTPEGNYVFGGRDGTIAIVTPDTSWDDFSMVAEPTMHTGANWEKETTSKTADGLLALARTFGASGPNADAHRFLLEAVAVAESGSPETRLRLGMILIQGSVGVPKDVERGIRLMASSAEAGYAMARLTYGMALINGANGLVPVDAAKGTELLQAAVRDADAADPEAKFQIVALLLQGAPGIPADRARAFELLGVAAAAGFAPAQFNYAQALMAGTPEVPADFARGLEMLKAAANQKVPDAAALLGQIYEAGQGVPADLKEAKGWYALAVNLGFRQAEPALQRVETKLQADATP